MILCHQQQKNKEIAYIADGSLLSKHLLQSKECKQYVFLNQGNAIQVSQEKHKIGIKSSITELLTGLPLLKQTPLPSTRLLTRETQYNQQQWARLRTNTRCPDKAERVTRGLSFATVKTKVLLIIQPKN